MATGFWDLQGFQFDKLRWSDMAERKEIELNN
jgi:hypothetical protein